MASKTSDLIVRLTWLQYPEKRISPRLSRQDCVYVRPTSAYEVAC